jgi:hypothetical protein
MDSEALLYYSDQDMSTHRFMIHKSCEDGIISEERAKVDLLIIVACAAAPTILLHVVATRVSVSVGC